MKETSFVFTPEGIETLIGEMEQLKAQREEKKRMDKSSDMGFLNERIQELEELVAHASVTEGTGPADHSIETGAVVKLRDVQFKEEVEYTVVNRFEADPLKNKLSEESPLGRVLISKHPGDQVSVAGPGDPLAYEIMAVEYRNT